VLCGCGSRGCGEGAAALPAPAPLSLYLRARVERVVECVADEVDAREQQDEQDGGEDEEPPGESTAVNDPGAVMPFAATASNPPSVGRVYSLRP
jgi:hypothetical protein